MASKKKPKNNIDLNKYFRDFGSQFRGLDTKNPYTWPAIPKYFLMLVVAALVLTALWFLWLQSVDEELNQEKAKELTLKKDYQDKLQKAVSLEELKKQKVQVMQYVNLLEKQLPSKAEMDALLSDINQAGLGRGLQFELFRPGQLVVKDYYAELPIALKVTGKFHDIGSFTSDIANLSRIVTLNNINVAPGGEKDKGNLSLEATAKTYRYLDPEEVAAQRTASKPVKKS